MSYYVECYVDFEIDTDSYDAAREIALDALSTIRDQAVFVTEPYGDVRAISKSR